MRTIHLNHMKLRDKLLLMYVLSVFIPIVMTNVVFYHVTTTNIHNQKIRDANRALENIRESFKVIVDQAAGLSYSFYADRIFNEYIARRYNGASDYVDAYNSYLKGQFSNSDRIIQSAYKVYTDNPTILSGYIEPLTDEIKSSGWYSEFKSFSAPYPTLISSDQSFSLIQRLDNYTTDFNQILKVDLNMKYISQSFGSNSFDGKVYLVDPQGRVQYSNDSDVNWALQTVMLQDIPLPSKSKEFQTTYTGINYLEGWTLHGVMNQEMVLNEVRKSGSFVILLACINFVVPSLIIAAISRSLHLRLVRILKHMKKVKNQNFQTIPHENGRDEIGQLTNEFNRMTERIDSLITDVYLTDIQKKDLELKQQRAQLHALHSQINPHFLFNALESIRMRSVIKGEEETADIIHNMAKMFRKSISWTRDWITVGEELEVIRCFLEIQKYRFDEELEYDVQVDENALHFMIPKMIFLPFVENSSIHGIESVPEKGIIRVRIGVQSNKLKFTLEDNGIGMSPLQLEEIREYLAQDDVMGERVGMKNTFHRLKLIYQDRFIFHIHSVEREGTHIEIVLPLPTDQ
ncbi:MULTISPECIES: cache domain-containing sensor histidine kinase [Paenibacillus]|uniref:cache domain-containing sensor histidine kinase n=1 Tax=Paenibacillus TaxID=44249 RepID=UPI0022B8E07E|nr:histidine kinase [Paenibacillus caseinilyticus]MCZ8517963.1 histidine kinase [Paenibacillus caseinilyticus]